ncbi:hypothetical protein [Flavobacterium sp. I3-2]|uniref:hypothetical protein n=1 Tax=Flavobacterium sp. I3-2 TaxID=2748319 RepID=UPI0015B01E4C|nr:hypothetical protein [Flavobacterium sp. I3-2]
METKKELFRKVDFNKKLQNPLETLVSQKLLCIAWYGHTVSNEKIKILWLYVKNKKEAAAVFYSQNTEIFWENEELLVVFLDEDDFKKHKKMRSPFIHLNLRKSELLYTDDVTAKPSDHFYWGDFEEFKEHYIETQQLLKSYTDDFIEDELEGSCYLFLKGFATDLGAVELLLLGTINENDSLTERLLLMEKICPIWKTVFVKEDTKTFYLIEQQGFSDAGIYDEWGKALKKVQKKIKNIVLQILEELEKEKNVISLKQSDTVPFGYLNHLKKLIDNEEVEEIFLFHERANFLDSKTVRCFYLLLIVKDKVSKPLKEIIRDIETANDEVQFTIIAHNRYYIQDKVYYQQGFYKKVCKAKNRIYTSGYYPDIHWHNTWYPEFNDNMLDIKYSSENIENFVDTEILAAKEPLVISSKKLYKCFVNKLQVNILYHLDYVPTTKNLNTLLQMVRYTGKTNEELEQLLQSIKPLLFNKDVNKNKVKEKSIRLEGQMLQNLQGFFKIINLA